MLRHIRRLLLPLIATASCVLGIAVPASALPPSEFIPEIAPWSRSGYETHKVPASVTIAQAILESGWGESGLTKKANNYFGIKCFRTVSPYQDGCYTVSTTEYKNGVAYTTSAKFRNYANPKDSFLDHGLFLVSNSRYANAFTYSGYADRFAYEIHKAGYATDPKYANSLISLMHQYNLYQYDPAPETAFATEIVARAPLSALTGTLLYARGLFGPNQPATQVWTQALVNGRWSTSQVRQATSRGTFQIPLTYGNTTYKKTTYRVQGRARNGKVYTSKPFTVNRTNTVSASAPQTSPVGVVAKVSGQVASKTAGAPTQTQVWLGDRWSTSQRGTTDENGRYSLPLSYGAYALRTLTYRVRIDVAGRALYSQTFSVTTTSRTTTKTPAFVRSYQQPLLRGTVSGITGAATAETQVWLGTRWSRSQIRPVVDGAFAIPMTYGTGRTGLTKWRVVIRPEGQHDFPSPVIELQRINDIDYQAPSSAYYTDTPSVRGTLPVGAPTMVAVQVWTGSGWGTSQRTTTNSNGAFQLPLTYGRGSTQTRSFRLIANANSTWVVSSTFSLTRYR